MVRIEGGLIKFGRREKDEATWRRRLKNGVNAMAERVKTLTH